MAEFDTPPRTPTPPPELPALPQYGDVGNYFDPQGQPYVPLPGQSPDEFPAPQIGGGSSGGSGNAGGGGAAPPPVPAVGAGGSSALATLDFGGAFYSPGARGRLSDKQLRRLLGERVQVPGLASILGTYRYVPGRYERAARQLIRYGLSQTKRTIKSLVRGAIPRVEKIVPKGGLPVIYKGIPEVAPRVAYKLGGAIGAIVGLAIPTRLDSGEVPLGPIPPLAAGAYWPEGRNPNRVRRQQEEDRLNREILQGDRLLHPRVGAPPQAPLKRDRIPEPIANVPKMGVRELVERSVTNYGADWLCQQAPLLCGAIRAQKKRHQDEADRLRDGAAQGPQPLPGSIGNPGQVNLPGPSSTSSTSSSSSKKRGRIRFGQLGTAIGIGLLIEGRHGRRSASQPFVNEITNIPGSQNVTPQLPIAGTTAQMQFFSGDSFGGSNYCTPRPRGPRRKCLQRAPVRWAGGARKGKSAGSKCLRFASRRST